MQPPHFHLLPVSPALAWPHPLRSANTASSFSGPECLLCPLILHHGSQLQSHGSDIVHRVSHVTSGFPKPVRIQMGSMDWENQKRTGICKIEQRDPKFNLRPPERGSEANSLLFLHALVSVGFCFLEIVMVSPARVFVVVRS